jgi:hypothetical protein
MSTHLPWQFSLNPFYNASKNSFVKFNKIIMDHTGRLGGVCKGNPVLTAIFEGRMKPSQEEWTEKYAIWDASQGEKMGETLAMKLLLAELKGRSMARWSNRIEAVFPPDTPEYLRFFPEGRKPYNTAVTDERISYFNVLVGMVLDEPLLAGIHTEMKDFQEKLGAARLRQQGLEGKVSHLSGILKLQQKQSANVMYAVLGLLMAHHAENSNALEIYYELSLIRSTGRKAKKAAPEPEEEASGGK